MSRTPNRLTPEQLAKATAMRRDNLGYTKIGEAIGASYYQVRRELDPEWHQRLVKRHREEYNLNTRVVAGIHLGEEHNVTRNPEFDPKRDGYPVYASPFSELLGEPPIGRRAIDTRRGA